MLDVLIGFLPWILLKLISPFSLPLAIVFAILSFLFSYSRLKKGFILEWGSFLFFLLSFIFIVLIPSKWFFQHMGLLTSASLALIVWISVLVKRPFTLEYAKLKIAKIYWNSLIFLRINQLMTIAFGVLFIINALFEVYKFYHPDISPILSWGSFGFTIFFVAFFPKWFPKWYKKRHHL